MEKKYGKPVRLQGHSGTWGYAKNKAIRQECSPRVGSDRGMKKALVDGVPALESSNNFWHWVRPTFSVTNSRWKQGKAGKTGFDKCATILKAHWMSETLDILLGDYGRYFDRFQTLFNSASVNGTSGADGAAETEIAL